MSNNHTHRLAFILNANVANKQQFISDVHELFNDIDHTIFETQFTQHATQLCKQAVDDNYTCIISCGGDGTLNECANGILQNQSQAKVQLALLPLGTGNDFARTVYAKNNLAILKKNIVENKIRLIDAGKIILHDNAPPHYFINIADAGFGAAVVQHMLLSKNTFGKKNQYHLSILRTFFSYKKLQLEITADDFYYKGKVMMVAIANGKYFGSGMGIAPDAKIDDGLFNVVLIGDISIVDYLLNVQKLKDAEKLNHKAVMYCKAKKIAIKNIDTQHLFCEADGELMGSGNVEIEMMERVICLVA